MSPVVRLAVTGAAMVAFFLPIRCAFREMAKRDSACLLFDR
jgi:hypothetical protein